MAKNNLVGERGKQEIIITRVFDAPRELVWKAWTDPEHFQRWWGPKDYTVHFARWTSAWEANISTVCARLRDRIIGAQVFIAKLFPWSELSTPIALPMLKAMWSRQLIME